MEKLSVVLNLGDGALKAPCVNSRPRLLAHIETIGLIMLLMLMCYPAGCDTVTPEREEMK